MDLFSAWTNHPDIVYMNREHNPTACICARIGVTSSAFSVLSSRWQNLWGPHISHKHPLYFNICFFFSNYLKEAVLLLSSQLVPQPHSLRPHSVTGAPGSYFPSLPGLSTTGPLPSLRDGPTHTVMDKKNITASAISGCQNCGGMPLILGDYPCARGDIPFNISACGNTQQGKLLLARALCLYVFLLMHYVTCCFAF